MKRTSRVCCSHLFVIAASASLISAAQAQTARQVAAPASDIASGVVRLPDPSSTPTVSHAATMPLRFERVPNEGWTAEVVLPVERRGPAAIALLSPDAGLWRVEVALPGAAPRPIGEALALEHFLGPAGDELSGWVVDRYDVRDAPAGTWTVRVGAPDMSGDQRPAAGWLILRPAGDLRAEAHVTTQRLVGGEVIGVVARVRGELAEPRVEQASLVLEYAGRSEPLPMYDDGRHEDDLAGDGLFGALVPESVRGEVRAHVSLAGSTRDAGQFVRTVDLSFPVLERRLALDGRAEVIPIDGQHLSIEIGALPIGGIGAPDSARRVHVSAEVWGSDGAGRMAPVCWLSREAEIVERASGRATLPLTLDTRWLAVTGAVAPFELRQVRAQDPDTEVVFDLVERMLIEVPALPPSGPGPHAITSEMLTGGSSLTLPSSTSPLGPHARANPTLFNPALMLVHGYCSGGAIWPAADFTQPKVQFLDPNANRSHDQFAQLIVQQAQAANVSSFGIVAHSQGGCAALHLLTYYTSGLDFALGGRRIQALATPFQGTPLASWGGFACGVNNDMTLAGSATWLAGIPTWARAEVDYWTTSNTGSACNFITNLLLTDPEDGTVEQIHGQLPGAVNKGHTTGWCHTTGMSNPASYTDHTRNQAMNAAASR